MNWVASHLATRRILQGVVQNERFLLEKGWGQGAISEIKIKLKIKGYF